MPIRVELTIIHRSHASVTNSQFLALSMPEAIAIVEKSENYQEHQFYCSTIK